MLPEAFLRRPIAHRALHDVAHGRPENSRAAIRAAVAAGYGIEIDLQPSSDGVPMVFHDYDMARLTGQAGAVAAVPVDELAGRRLLGGDEGVPTLAEVLEIVGGAVPLVIEVKDQDGALGPGVGRLERAAADLLRGYEGPVAVMSFNPHSVEVLAEALPDVPRGLVTCDWAAKDWPLVPEARRQALRAIPDVERLGCDFISHDVRDLQAPRVAEVKAGGRSILCWTVRSPEAEREARKVADQVTFEGYLA
ncbi:glycerophosphodiester phosphodiesterase family protein [Pseudaestuariivita atlantica]|uniref:Phosphodiesterase n=1 Tax=Pseudaestuariivita atlantica TaxID=1317121 RepID=A0A0L1JSE6_9RHOB|nr:glycerophosphodiester phosphodiesterase family protein [Pseudaestuariivita atlantica]KNG94709.1 phosphodiesterase [Pseudaestuariivita atlantica]